MKSRIFGCGVLVSSALLAAWSEKASNRDSAQDKSQATIKQTVDVPMRDGIALRGFGFGGLREVGAGRVLLLPLLNFAFGEPALLVALGFALLPGDVRKILGLPVLLA